jgi:hypothetical protein
MRKKVIYSLILLLVGTYFGTYGIVRERSKVYQETDGCPSTGCVRIQFHLRGINTIYLPIAGWDKLINEHNGFRIIR